MVRRWNAETGERLAVWRAHDRGLVSSAAFAPEGVCRVQDCAHLRVWDGENGHSCTRSIRRREDVTHVAWSADGTLLAAAEQGRRRDAVERRRITRTWTTPPRRGVARDPSVPHVTTSPGLDEAGNPYGACTRTPTVPSYTEPPHTISVRVDRVRIPGWSPHAHESATGWCPRGGSSTGRPVMTLKGHRFGVHHLGARRCSASASAATIASTSRDHTLRTPRTDPAAHGRPGARCPTQLLHYPLANAVARSAPGIHVPMPNRSGSGHGEGHAAWPRWTVQGSVRPASDRRVPPQTFTRRYSVLVRHPEHPPRSTRVDDAVAVDVLHHAARTPAAEEKEQIREGHLAVSVGTPATLPDELLEAPVHVIDAKWTSPLNGGIRRERHLADDPEVVVNDTVETGGGSNSATLIQPRSKSERIRASVGSSTTRCRLRRSGPRGGWGGEDERTVEVVGETIGSVSGPRLAGVSDLGRGRGEESGKIKGWSETHRSMERSRASRGFRAEHDGDLLRPVPAYAVKMGKVSSEVRWDGRSAVRAQIFKRTDMWRVPRGSKSGLKWGRGRTSLASARR